MLIKKCMQTTNYNVRDWPFYDLSTLAEQIYKDFPKFFIPNENVINIFRSTLSKSGYNFSYPPGLNYCNPLTANFDTELVASVQKR